jgi:spermidine synthase
LKDSDDNARTPKDTFVYVIFFASGAAALVYEASWSRLIGLAIGNTAQAAALVLASYFTGLAIGQFLGGRIAPRVSPLFGYGVAELIAAGWAFLVPGLLDWVGLGDRELFGDSHASRAGWCFAILLPATIPLGATFPMVIETLHAPGGSRRRATVAYGLNTAGGLIGIVAATAFLLVVVGVRTSGFLAAAISVACSVSACAVAAYEHTAARSERESQVAVDEATHEGSWVWTTVAVISGFGILGLEALYLRMFSLIFHNSVYTFGTVIGGFLLALSLGTAITSWIGDRISTRTVAAAGFALGSVTLVIAVAAFPVATGLSYFSYGGSFGGYLAGAIGLVSLFVLPPVALLGMVLPSAIHATSSSRRIGRLLSANTLSGAAGAVAGGFFLPQSLGLWSSFAAFAALFGIIGAMALLRNGHRSLACASVMSTALSVVLLASGVAADRSHANGDELIRRWDSAYGWVDVVRTKHGSLAVSQNLHYRHGSTAYAIREYRQGRLPLLLHKRPADVAFLGMGTGLTAAPAVRDGSVEHAMVIELIPEVLEAARLLSDFNFGVVDHPKVEIRVGDARHELHRSRRHYDAIVADLFVPWESGAGYLHTVEFYESVRRTLKPGGLFCQWLALYQLGPEEFELIADSFSSVFPNTTLWWGQLDSKHPIVALVGCDEPLDVDTDGLEDRMDAWNDLPDGRDPDLRVPSDLAALYLGEWTRDPARKRNTDEHPWLEFTAPISHRSGRTLHGPVLKRYFDRVLIRLPSGGVRFGGELEPQVQQNGRRRVIQRLSLFGDVP